MLFKKDVLSAIARGEVTTAYRRWQRPTVRAGGTLRTAAGVLAIESVDEVDVEDISERAARAAGYESLAGPANTWPKGRAGSIEFDSD